MAEKHPLADIPDRLAEVERHVANVVRLGVIAEADYARALVRVSSGDQMTDWLPWLTRRAGGDIDWWAPEIGEQVVIFSPAGDPAQGVVLAGVYASAAPAPADRESVRRVAYSGGAAYQFDRDTQTFTFKTGSSELIVAPGAVKVRADRIDWNDDR